MIIKIFIASIVMICALVIGQTGSMKERLGGLLADLKADYEQNPRKIFAQVICLIGSLFFYPYCGFWSFVALTCYLLITTSIKMAEDVYNIFLGLLETVLHFALKARLFILFGTLQWVRNTDLDLSQIAFENYFSKPLIFAVVMAIIGMILKNVFKHASFSYSSNLKLIGRNNIFEIGTKRKGK